MSHTNRPRPCLQTHEEYLWRRFMMANRRVAAAMLVHDAELAEMQKAPRRCKKCGQSLPPNK
jgi:hypothetical protein